jgi:hypothetical protein
LKYADDSISICPEKSVVSVEDEVASLVRWSTGNELVTNLLKSKEMLFQTHNPLPFLPPPPLSVHMTRFCVLKLLSVTLCSDLRFG